MRTQETKVKRSVMIDAPPEVIWKALRQRGLGSFHLLREAEGISFHEGDRLSWYGLEDEEQGPRITGRMMIVVPPRHITFTVFMPATGLPDTPENYTLVDMTLAPQEDGRTLVTVDHGDFAAQPKGPRLAREAGNSWVEALIRLREQVEHGAAA